MKLKYYNNLDGMRGIAALMVVIFHFFYSDCVKYLDNISLYQNATEFGQHGVSLFFVLSGFVITRILINTRQNPNYFSTFYWKRILRILPLYYLYLFVVYFISPLILQTSFTNIKLQLPFYFYCQNLTEVLNIHASGPGHYWSLAVEEHFYLIWPFIIYLIKPKYLLNLIMLTVISIFFLKYYMLNNGLAIEFFTFTRIDQLMMGAYIAVLELKGFFYKKNSLIQMILIGLSIFPISIFVYIFSANFYFLKQMIKYPLLGLFFFSLLGSIISLNSKSLINKVLSSIIFQYFGRISYGIYIWHILAIGIVGKFFITKILVLDLLIVIILTLLFAHISYYYFEIVFLKLKDKQPSFIKSLYFL